MQQRDCQRGVLLLFFEFVLLLFVINAMQRVLTNESADFIRQPEVEEKMVRHSQER